ncbi:MAG: tripartite tricarboxylate transporter TctB family protein [Proteobacteria bacterium]|nr:tripartite tricarboxylate transporter TctB family protein [Pseudomonadota bacterium]
MRKAEIWVSLAFMLLGVIVIADSIRLGFMWGRTGPASGFFPFYLAVGMVISSVIVFFNAFTLYKKEGAGKPLMPPGALKSILWVVIPSTVMVMLMEFVGLHIAAALFLGFYMRAVGKIGWTTTLLVGIIAPLSLYITFDKLFLIPLPQGLWGGYILRF